jgi:Na+/melibiose symporter-like transporter
MTIDFKNSKQYILFITITALFVITIIMCIFVYFKLNEKVKENDLENKMSVEINLPVIEWGKYENLSKKYTNGSIE